MDGTSLRGLMEGTASDHRAVVSVLHGFSDLLRWDTIAVRDATTTLYLSPRQRGWVQYDSARDAREQFPMPVRNPRLRSRARKAADETRLPPAENAEVRTVDLPEAMRDRLKALGYVE